MGHHLNGEGKFKSDKYSWCPPGYFVLSFRDSLARRAMREYARLTTDRELANDINTAIENALRDEDAEKRARERRG